MSENKPVKNMKVAMSVSRKRRRKRKRKIMAANANPLLKQRYKNPIVSNPPDTDYYRISFLSNTTKQKLYETYRSIKKNDTNENESIMKQSTNTPIKNKSDENDENESVVTDTTKSKENGSNTETGTNVLKEIDTGNISFLTEKEKFDLYDKYRGRVKPLPKNDQSKKGRKSNKQQSTDCNIKNKNDLNEEKSEIIPLNGKNSEIIPLNDQCSVNTKPETITSENQCQNDFKELPEPPRLEIIENVTSPVYCTGITKLKINKPIDVTHDPNVSTQNLVSMLTNIAKRRLSEQNSEIEFQSKKLITSTHQWERSNALRIEWERKEQREQFRNKSIHNLDRNQVDSTKLCDKCGNGIERYDLKTTQNLYSEYEPVLKRQRIETSEGSKRIVSQSDHRRDSNLEIQLTRTEREQIIAEQTLKLKQIQEKTPTMKLLQETSNSNQGIKMVVVPCDYPKTTLTSVQISVLKEYLYSELPRTRERKTIQIRDCHQIKGSLYVNCLNEQTCDWLEVAVAKCFLWRSIYLSVKKYDELHGFVRILLSIPDKTSSTSEILEKLSLQNLLDTEQWRVINKYFKNETQQLVIVVDKLSYIKLNSLNFKLRYDYNIVVGM